LPYLPKGWIYVAGAISTYQVDLPVEIARTHEGAYVRHRRSGTPRVGRYVVDARGIDHRPGGRIVPTEDEELVDVGRIHRRSLSVEQIGHWRQRRPSVGSRVKLPKLVDGATGREGVTASLIRNGAIAVHEPSVMVNPYRRRLCPRPGAAARRARRCRARSSAWSANQPPARVHYHCPERPCPLAGTITHIGIHPYAGMPVVGLVGTQLRIVLIQRH